MKSPSECEAVHSPDLIKILERWELDLHISVLLHGVVNEREGKCTFIAKRFTV
jgi:hypothetical protein